MKTHIMILADSLEKKSAVLSDIILLNEELSKLIKEEPFDFDEFDRKMDERIPLVDQLNSLDDGFESVYEKVRTELLEHSEDHKAVISEMQDRIREITDKEVKIRAQETRLQQAVKSRQQTKSAELRQNRSTLKVSQNYYQVMNRLNINGSPFMDRKQ